MSSRRNISLYIQPTISTRKKKSQLYTTHIKPPFFSPCITLISTSCAASTVSSQHNTDRGVKAQESRPPPPGVRCGGELNLETLSSDGADKKKEALQEHQKQGDDARERKRKEKKREIERGQ
jgi:hypothetical protein